MLSEKHVAVLAFPFGSHPWPLVNLFRKLAATATDVHFSFLNTAKSNSVLFPPPSKAELPPNVGVYDVADGLPVDEGEMVRHPPEQVELFLRAAPESFGAAIDAAERDVKKKVSCLLTDAFLTFACEMAEKRQIPWIAFWIPAPYSLSTHVYTDVINQLRHESGDASDFKDRKLEIIPGLSLMRIGDLPDEIIKDEDSSMLSSVLRQMGRVLPRAAVVVMNSYEEANPAPLIADLKSKFKILLHLGCLTVSFLPTLRPPSSSSTDQTGCLAWLDMQAPQTVAYISFGTVAMPSPGELLALAEALECTKTPFLWSIKEHLLVHLPRGFVERTSAYAKLVAWAPQSQVLSHPACGAYVTHCGYNSVFESVAGGVAMICKPFWADNMMNGRMIEEVWGIGVRVEGGIITKSGMTEALELVLRSERGKKMKEKTMEFRARLVEAAGPRGNAAADFKTLVELISAS